MTKPLSVRDKGPLFLIYPFDQYPELRNKLYYSAPSARSAGSRWSRSHRNPWQRVNVPLLVVLCVLLLAFAGISTIQYRQFRNCHAAPARVTTTSCGTISSSTTRHCAFKRALARLTSQIPAQIRHPDQRMDLVLESEIATCCNTRPSTSRPARRCAVLPPWPISG